MRTIPASGGYYKIKVGGRECKVYVADLKMITKKRKSKTPPVPCYDDDSMLNSLVKKDSETA